MPNNDLIGYNYNAIFEGISQMNKVNKNIEGLIEKLSQETGTALDNWTGSAAGSYNVMANDIEQKISDMNSIVHGLASQIGIRSDDMKQQDARSGNRFQ
ncbi:WXG100 family type VII secretion target [Actinoplanes sp. NBRC 103695]|uniref:WXG100 family type VII secretion target n=1 Tax=Actinoplanes sp. NBRC 103695 TaxID=3032202 RepID=UPI0024A470EA|nr:WXG100 family type VII secretion target [Actinoplanes sp. NBRC 103695]GLZ02003.1 hypothetical protein Acsp02_92540 [Actinoplanes sp. NBRC 103695]